MTRNFHTDFNHTVSGYTDNVHEIDSDLRANCPVARGEDFGGYWVLSRFRDVQRLYKELDSFSSRQGITFPPIQNPLPALPSEADGELHRAYRDIVAAWFDRKAVKSFEPRIRELVTELIDGFEARGQCEFISEFAVPLPATVISVLMGLPREEWPEVKVLILNLVANAVAEDTDAAMNNFQQLLGYLSERLDARRSDPQDDLLTRVAEAQVEDRPLTRDEMLGLLLSLVSAGQETTANAIGNLALRLATHPEERQRLADQPDLIPLAVEESLRWETPVHVASRVATADMELHGRCIKEGDRVAGLIGSANRDERKFPRAGEFILDRKPNRHIAFGSGVHQCLGIHLARVEMRVVFEELLLRLPGFHVAGEVVRTFPGGQFLGVGRLPLAFGN
jgi:cytochrome P450